MSLFGTSPPEDAAPSMNSSFARSRHSLFDDDATMSASQSNSLFNDDDGLGSGGASPWDMPTPRKQQNRAELLRNLLPASDVPDKYIELFDDVAKDDSRGGKITAAGVARTLNASSLGADQQGRIMSIIAPAGGSGDSDLGRNEFNALLALIGLAQEGETLSLDGVDERRRNLPTPQLVGLTSSKAPGPSDFSELAAKPPQRPVTPTKASTSSPQRQRSAKKVTMEYPDDPWNTQGQADPAGLNGSQDHPATLNGNSEPERTASAPVASPMRTTSTFTTATAPETVQPIATTSPRGAGDTRQNLGGMGQSPGGGWDYFASNSTAAGGGFDQAGISPQGSNPFGTLGSGDRNPDGGLPSGQPSRTIGSGRTGSSIEETVLVTLMPEKEGMFMFQHHNYEVSSSRRGSKVVRRYSDFVWLLDCLHKRYAFRVLPLLPPKRVAVNGNHLSNDGAFIEKRRRGLARFLNALVRHPVLGQEQLVIMFLTVPTELSVWRKQANLSVQDEFAGRPLPAGLEESLSPQLGELFERTRGGVRRSADLYISVCNIMDRLVKRSEGVAADHARIAMSLQSLTESSTDTYATDTNNVPLLNDGLTSMSKHLRTGQSLMEDEARAWDEGVLEDLKRQRDALVSLRDLFDRHERLDKDNIPYLERRIQTNETKLAGLRAKPEGLVKPGEIEKVVDAIIKDKESIVNQHNRSVFVKECLRDELVYFQNTQYHVSRWNQDWAQERVKYAEMLADNWRRLLDGLDGMPLGEWNSDQAVVVSTLSSCLGIRHSI